MTAKLLGSCDCCGRCGPIEDTALCVRIGNLCPWCQADPNRQEAYLVVQWQSPAVGIGIVLGILGTLIVQWISG